MNAFAQCRQPLFTATRVTRLGGRAFLAQLPLTAVGRHLQAPVDPQRLVDPRHLEQHTHRVPRSPWHTVFCNVSGRWLRGAPDLEPVCVQGFDKAGRSDAL